MSSKFSTIRPRTTESAALARLKKSHILIMGKTTSSQFISNFYLILFILAGNNDIHKSLDEFENRSDLTMEQS